MTGYDILVPMTKLQQIMQRAERWSEMEQEALVRVAEDIENLHSNAEELTEEDWKIIDARSP